MGALARSYRVRATTRHPQTTHAVSAATLRQNVEHRKGCALRCTAMGRAKLCGLVPRHRQLGSIERQRARGVHTLPHVSHALGGAGVGAGAETDQGGHAGRAGGGALQGSRAGRGRHAEHCVARMVTAAPDNY